MYRKLTAVKSQKLRTADVDVTARVSRTDVLNVRVYGKLGVHFRWNFGLSYFWNVIKHQNNHRAFF